MSEQQKKYYELANQALQDIYNYLKNERHVEYFVHFTPIENVESILKYGILPRSDLEKKGLKFTSIDENRFEGKNCTNLSISFPNYKLLYKRTKQNIHHALLFIDIDCIKDLSVGNLYFIPVNAASYCLNYKDVKYNYVDAAKRLFSSANRYNGIQHNSDETIPSWYTSNPQAEVIVDDFIDKKYIKKIICNDDKDIEIINKACIINNRQDLMLKSKNAQDNKFFGPRQDFRCWQQISGRLNG